jgi:hypothetical protein
MLLQYHLDATKTNQREAIIFAQEDGSAFAIHLEYCLMTVSDHVDVRRTVVIGVDHDTPPGKTENGWHSDYNPIGWVYARNPCYSLL